MAISESQFNKYAESKKNEKLTSALHKKKYSHHRVFDDPFNKKDEEQSETNILIKEIDTDKIINWELHDRPENELGNIEDLANNIKQIGQLQPCVVRPHPNKDSMYELIIGERRWRAVMLLGLKLKVEIKDFTDKQAILSQAAENDRRKNLSDYAKGVHFAKLIEKGFIKQKDLISELGKSKQYVSALLSFSKIPQAILEEIDDMSQISARTAEKIKQLSGKGDSYVEAIISLADKLREAQIGHEKLESLVNCIIKKNKYKLNETTHNVENDKIYSNTGRHLFTWRLDNNKKPSIHFPKDIVKLINNSVINKDEVNKGIIDLIEKQIDQK